MSVSVLVLAFLLCAAFALGAWTGLFGAHARATARRVFKGRRARRREREMLEIMREKIARAEARRGGGHNS